LILIEVQYFAMSRIIHWLEGNLQIEL